jgi:fumarate reductase flavoprotein subunit
VPTALVRDAVAAERAALDVLLGSGGGESADAIRAEMQQAMTDGVGIFRDGAGLETAVGRLQALLLRSRAIGVRNRADGPNPELVTAYRVQRMLKVALAMACGALARQESRGAHFRLDYPRRDDAHWLKRTLATWRNPADSLPTLDYEPIDVGAMELPPGWRGYGARDYLDHPDTARRTAEVQAVRERCQGRSRQDLQQALMPYRDLLPATLRSGNERLQEEPA